MTSIPLPSLEFLHECFLYDPKTGSFIWKARPSHHFDRPDTERGWNGRWAGTPAFISVDKDGYLRAEVVYEGRRHRLRAARVAYKLMTGEEPVIIDHKNTVRTDDRFENLRPADNQRNAFNQAGRAKNPLPKGVYFDRGGFYAKGGIDGRGVHLGCFGTPAEAHAAYCEWAKARHGEFFNPGPPKPSVFD